MQVRHGRDERLVTRSRGAEVLAHPLGGLRVGWPILDGESLRRDIAEIRSRPDAREDAAEDALSKFDAAPLTGNYRGKAEAFRSALAAAEAELDEALATARSSTSGALADGSDADDALAED